VTKDLLPHIKVYTDGACKGNPGPGGWGALLIAGDKRKEIYGGEPHTTNNRMELTAVIEAIKTVKKKCIIDVYTDSVYVQKGLNEYLANWQKNGWKTAAKKPVKNVDLWQEVASLLDNHYLTFHWVKGHAGHPENERADELANLGIEGSSP
jgi:ribonuclease HI